MRALGSAGLREDTLHRAGRPLRIARWRRHHNIMGTVKLTWRGPKMAILFGSCSQAAAAVLEISRQTAKARSREARRTAAVADSG